MTSRHKDLFKLPNSIFTVSLSATELRVMAVIYSLRSKSVYRGRKFIKINQKAIATICGFKSTVTVSKAVDTLCRYGYLRIERFYSDYKKLGTYVYTIPVLTRDYFFVQRSFLNYKLTAAQTRMYLFFCKCSESRSKRFWNSYNDICCLLNLKRSAVIKTISELIEIGLIKRYRVKKRDGSYSDNHYRINNLSKRIIKRKKRRCPIQPNIFSAHRNVKLFYISIVHRNCKSVNREFAIFFGRGSPKICRSLIVPTFDTNRRRNNTRLYLKYRCNLRLCESR